MAGSNTIHKLTRTYALLRGKYEVIEREIEHVNGIDNMLREINRIDRDKRAMLKELDAIAIAAKLIDPAWKREAVRPIHPCKTDRNSKLICVTAYKVLRTAKSPLRTREISRQVAEILGIELCERELARLDPPIHNVLKAKIGWTVIASGERPIRWSFMPRDQIRSPEKRAFQEALALQGVAAQPRQTVRR